MTFNNLINHLKEKYEIIDMNEIYSIIFYLSKIASNKVNLIINLKNEIDFKAEEADNLLDKYFNQKIPLAYITNKVEFCGNSLCIDENVLIPRIETEMMVDDIINELDKDIPIEVLDLCSGSGCIAFAIKKHIPKAKVTAIDKFDGPISVINKNKKILGLDIDVIQQDLIEFIDKPFKTFDLIICNPPYINPNFQLDEYCKKEPKTALFAEDEGLFYIKKLIDNYQQILKPNGSLYIEIGFDQIDKINEYVNFKKITYKTYKDLYNINRYIRFTK